METDILLVIGTDASGSIDESEAFLQRKGVAEAFRSREVIDAIRSGGLGRIAVTYVEFSSLFYNNVVIEWFLIDSEESALAFAGQLMRIPITWGRGTSLSDAIELGMHLIDESPYTAQKRIIDLSGDGPNNTGRPVREVRDEAVAAGIVINGLPIIDPRGRQGIADLDAYFAACVIGGVDSFYYVAEGFDDFPRAIRRKLVLELSGLSPEEMPAARTTLFRIAADPLQRLPRPAPQAPAYEGACDTWGFF